METIQIFIVSSSELQQDRKDFKAFLGRRNDRDHKRGIYLKSEQWEYFQDAVSKTRKQDDYNQRIKECQIVICLFYTKAGKYSQEEFDTALTHFKQTGSPLIYTYFKDGAPEPDPKDQLTLDLVDFKKRLSDLGHFYTSYSNIDDLKVKFAEQLELLEDKGYENLQKEVKEKTQDAVTNYFNIKNAIIDSTITAGGDVHVGDKTANTAAVEGSGNIIIQGVSDSTITVNVNGEMTELKKDITAMKDFMEKLASKSFQSADKVYDFGNITNANFRYIIEQAGRDKSLPAELSEDLWGEGDGWIQSLGLELKDNQNVSVKNKSSDIFQNYAWLVETFLQKMVTAPGRKKDLRRMSFMVEAYQASLRYLCYIQVAQFLQLENKPQLGILSEFLQMKDKSYVNFNYTSFLIAITEAIGTDGFMPELHNFVKELANTDSSLYSISLFLDDQRNQLMNNKIKEDDTLPLLLEQYLTALVEWLRKVSFLAKYRLVSIKEINLDYRLGSSASNFVHLYGELNGIYSDTDASNEDYNTKSIEGAFTYNKSVLLFRGDNVSTGLDNIQEKRNYLSLSPLVIDQSVYSSKPKQTPEIFYYVGYDKDKKQYHYSQYKNELPYSGGEEITSNKSLYIKSQNNKQPLLNRLFKQLEDIFNPLKSEKS